MPSRKRNCWEYMHCGREHGGKNADSLGVCPASTDSTFNGFNLGVNSGRICWLVAGTFCDGNVRMGTVAEKRNSCNNCDFYKQVHAEEGSTSRIEEAMNIFALTHIGLTKKVNEDRYFIKKLDDGAMLLSIADGLGGEVAGDYAAEVMIGKLAGVRRASEDREEQLSRLAVETDLAISDESEKKADLEAMATTLICVLLTDKLAWWVHVGDSRIYILRDRRLLQVTEDQTLARFLVEEGEITPEQAPTHYSRHVMDQSIGCGFCEPETGRLELRDKDLLILTTDGLHKSVPEDAMTAILNNRTDISTGAKALVSAALDAGGNDNITVVICEIGEQNPLNHKD
ncbi:MAG: serine/threonine-protein phosphatase [Desulfobacterales bacterium]|nr:serine/threonine-protein phosphatase [Desulfobacterales bacterium]